MSRWLICSRVEAEVQHECSLVFRGDDVSTAEGVRNVIAEEGGFVSREDIDTVGLELKSVNSFGDDWVDQSFVHLAG